MALNKKFIKGLFQTKVAAYSLGAFVVATGLSYVMFRDPPLKVTVQLATVEFRDEIPQEVVLESVVKPEKSIEILSKRVGRIDRITAKSGDFVRKEQLLVVLNESESKSAVESALVQFKVDSNPENRANLQASKQILEDNLLRAPSDGYFWTGTSKLGDVLAQNAKVAEVGDLSKISFAVKVPAAVGQKLSSIATITVSPMNANSAPIATNILADVRFNASKIPTPNSDADVVLTVAANPEMVSLLYQPVRIKISLDHLKKVALIDKSAMIANAGESRILVVNSIGMLRWQKVSSTALFEDKVVVSGVDSKTFQVVKPDHLELLNKAITLNVKPAVKGVM